MTGLDFGNSVSAQPYPFQPGYAAFGAYTLTYDVILDVEIVWGASTPYVYADTTNLTRIVADASNVTFKFEYPSGTETITFTVPRTAAVGDTVYASAAGGPAAGTGFLQVGVITGIPNGTYTGTAALELTRVQANYQHEITSINVANKPSTVWTNTDCGADFVGDASLYVVEATGLTGDITFSPGRFLTITQQNSTRTLAFSPTSEAGGGVVGPASAYSVVPDGYGSLDDNAQKCKDLVATINGITANKLSNVFTLRGSRGVTVTPEPGSSPHVLNIALYQNALFKG